MEVTHDEVLEILALVEATDVEYLELEVAGTRIVVDKSGSHTVARATRSASETEVSSASTEVAAATPSSPSAVAAISEPTEEAAASTADRDGLVTIEAPMVGVFYRAPEPGAAPYIDVGDRIDADDTVGVVEVMKMINSITAGVSGTVIKILAENEQFVEHGEPLILVRPESDK